MDGVIDIRSVLPMSNVPVYEVDVLCYVIIDRTAENRTSSTSKTDSAAKFESVSALGLLLLIISWSVMQCRHVMGCEMCHIQFFPKIQYW